MCCNGVLFADVRLQRGDDATRLIELGVPLKSGQSNARFRQPCSCLQNGACRIYDERPNRCRTFECRLLQRTLTGEVKERAALNLIREAKQRIQRVQSILRKLGEVDESVPLSRRYQRVMRQPVDLSGPEHIVELRGQLLTAVADLASVLERDFLG